MENELEDALAELAALRKEFAKERRPVYGTMGNPSFSTSGMPPSRYLCTKCMRSFAVSDETCPTCALTARAVRAEADARALREMADEMPRYADYEALHQIANRLSPSTAMVRDNASGIYGATKEEK